MLTERIWSGELLRNFFYLIADPDSGEALAVDPLDWRLVLDVAKKHGWTIKQILNTHEHSDHTGGNVGLKDATGAKVLAHEGAAPRIGTGIDRGLKKGDIIKVGRIELECLDTPGHTMTHVCVLSHTDTPALICGDTCLTPVSATATTAATRRCSTIPSHNRSRACRTSTRVYPVTSTGTQPRVHPRP
jgi:hydroxyacylglutathione hydrolase